MSPDNTAKVSLREITEETLGLILELEVAENQKAIETGEWENDEKVMKLSLSRRET